MKRYVLSYGFRENHKMPSLPQKYSLSLLQFSAGFVTFWVVFSFSFFQINKKTWRSFKNRARSLITEARSHSNFRHFIFIFQPWFLIHLWWKAGTDLENFGKWRLLHISDIHWNGKEMMKIIIVLKRNFKKICLQILLGSSFRLARCQLPDRCSWSCDQLVQSGAHEFTSRFLA